jgi:hypothetical protein
VKPAATQQLPPVEPRPDPPEQGTSGTLSESADHEQPHQTVPGTWQVSIARSENTSSPPTRTTAPDGVVAVASPGRNILGVSIAVALATVAILVALIVRSRRRLRA